jgi:general secretion pathway protein A
VASESTPAPTPTAAVTPKPTLEDFMAAHVESTDNASAFQALLGMWNIVFDEASSAAPPCEQATIAGLECHADKASFAELRTYNRPAIITLALSDGASRQVVLAALNDRSATLRVGQQTYEVDLLELERVWFGDYLILWKPPQNPAGLIRPGSHGPEVLWLRERLPNSGTAADPQTYDAALGREISTFQRAHHLASDGLAGTRTQLVLDGAYGRSEGPHLQAGAL